MISASIFCHDIYAMWWLFWIVFHLLISLGVKYLGPCWCYWWCVWTSKVRSTRLGITIWHFKRWYQSIPKSFLYCRSGKLNYTKALELTSYLQAEQEYVPWEAAIKSFNFIRSMLTPTRPAYKYLQVCIAFFCTHSTDRVIYFIYATVIPH